MNRIKKIAIYSLLILVTVFEGKLSFAQLQFIENKGQWQKEVDFKSDISNGGFFLQKNGFTVLLHNEGDMKAFEDHMHGHQTNDSIKIRPAGTSNPASSGNNKSISPQQNNGFTIRSHAYRVSFLNASASAKAQPDKALSTYNNYFIGNDKSKWQSNCKIYQGVTTKICTLILM